MKKNALVLLSVFLFAVSCVDPFNLKITTRKEILIIEGNVNDTDSIQTIVIKKNVPSTSNIKYIGVPSAIVEVIENGSTKYLCKEGTDGVYTLPAGFRGKVNSEYQLRVKLAEGKEYLSTKEKLNPVPEITRVFSRFMAKGILKGGKMVDGHAIYLDTRDLAGSDNFYAWESRVYEKQTICRTCEGGRYNSSPEPYGSCTANASLQQLGIIYDYNCNGNCWEIFNTESVNIMSDRFGNGGEINNRKIRDVPYYQDMGALVEVTQRSVTQLAFGYLDMVADQTQNTGSLADTPPAALVGNMRNTTDEYENVGGFFMVGSVRKKRFWLDRKDVPVNDTRVLHLLGRPTNLEPPNGMIPKTAFCLESFTRTAVKPKGWVD